MKKLEALAEAVFRDGPLPDSLLATDSNPDQTVGDAIAEASLPCPHARPTWRMCPHCLGLNGLPPAEPPKVSTRLIRQAHLFQLLPKAPPEPEGFLDLDFE